MIGVLRAFEDEGFDLDDLVDHELDGASSFVGAVDVDKMWQALSILTTPSPDPMRSIQDPDRLDPLLGGTPFGEDWGYGEPRHLTPDDVRAVHEHLAAWSDEEARTRFDPAAFAAAAVYPFVWDEPAEELWGDLHRLLGELRRFYAEAASTGRHVVLVLE